MTLDRDTGGRAALIIDRSSGRVRTIARDWSVEDAAPPAAMAADAQVEVIRDCREGEHDSRAPAPQPPPLRMPTTLRGLAHEP